jgi:outer membrane protein TolC
MRHARYSRIALAVALFAACPVVAQQPYPINLPTAMKLAGAEPLDIAIATARLQTAAAQLEKANVLWLPSVQVGADYFRQDGQIQDVVGNVFSTSKSTLMLGAGPGLVFAVSDAIFAPLAARQAVRAQEGGVQAAKNDSLYAVATAYFDVQQARGRIDGAADAVKRAEDLLRRVEKLGGALTPAVEVNRVRTELARRRQAVESAQESRETAGAELARLLRLPPASVVEPMEPPQLRVDLIDANQSVDELIPIGLTNRPELAANKALVLATLARLRQEKIRPLIPSLLIRGAATNPAGTLSTGYFGGGVNGNLTNFNARNTVDVQLLWELQNLGFGNRAAVRERHADNERAVLELFRIQDQVAAEVVQAHAQARRAANRVALAEEELTNARITAVKNLEGIGQTRRVGETLTLVFRPQEVVAAIAALDSAYQNYYGAIADANRAQFRLYRALGHPAQCVGEVRQYGAEVVP